MLTTAAARQKFRRRLLSWFRLHARDLPWRRTHDVYHIWVSEIMLQQTQVATVVSYFKRFVERFPNIQLLASADEQDVLRLWEGLGYYRRARQMHAAAKKIVDQHGGEFPRDVQQVQSLPGIGRYTAGAILSIAHNVRAPILEANTIRLLCRLLLLKDDPHRSHSQRLLWEFSASLLPRREAGTFNQALMELGSEICTPRTPRCEQCPVADLCPTRANGLQDSIPLAKPKKNYQSVVEAALVIASPQDHQQFLLRRCGPDERWSGLWDFPRFSVTSEHEACVHDELKSRMQAAACMNVEPLQFLDERGAFEVQELRGLTLVAARLLEAPRDQVAFELRDHRLEVYALVRDRDGRHQQRAG
jgi:A/G-specific adenine glycosylase